MAILGSLCLLMTLYVSECEGHGRMREPPSRSSMWRDGFSNPINYQDNELFCGGFSYQTKQGGRCGVCGDRYDAPKPREHEAGGQYANGIITRRYVEGSNIMVTIELTAHHRGYFEFRMCVNNDVQRAITHECLNENLLVFVNPAAGETRYFPTDAIHHYLTLQLPAGVTCEQCVIQWKYKAGNSYGTDPDTGIGCVGCGAQEEFYGCSDIAISTFDNNNSLPPRNIEPTTILPMIRIVESTNGTFEPTNPTTGPTTEDLVCHSIGKWNSDRADEWCNVRCNSGYCPALHCTCDVDDVSPICTSVGAFSARQGADNWCQKNCDNGYCPSRHCVCTP